MREFIKKHIILKKRKPTDSIFAEKRSAVAITFALMVPIFAIMIFITFDVCTLYYVDELVSMGLDGAGTLISAAGYQIATNDYNVSRNAQIMLSGTFCQYAALYNCWGGAMGPLLPNNVSHWQWKQVNLPYGGVIQAKGYATGLLTGFGISNLTGSGVTATSVVRFLNQ
ncbi:MAG: hypothetical protein J6P19_02795 [Acetobacter sp.]|nr:hypothetical protein [Acetobacter sp.]